jgi:hypothetical protein
MRLKAVFPVVVLLFTAAGILFAAPGLRWSTSLDTIVSTGDTRYLMEEPAGGFSSELIFPLNTLMAGVTIRRDLSGARPGSYLEAQVSTNLLAPFGKMVDYDWWMYPGYPKVPWSYTESDARLFGVSAALYWKPVLANHSWGNFGASFGYRFKYYYQEAIGFNGWQYADVYIDAVNDAEDGWYTMAVGVDDPRLGITYWVMYNFPTAGLSLTLKPQAGFSLHGEAGLAVAYASDEDDHVLRNKLSTASGLGFGGYLDLSVRFTWGNPNARLHPFIALSANALALKANVLQKQTWYGDDPVSTSVIEKPGDSITGLDHQISTRQFGVALTGGIEF